MAFFLITTEFTQGLISQNIELGGSLHFSAVGEKTEFFFSLKIKWKYVEGKIMKGLVILRFHGHLHSQAISSLTRAGSHPAI